MWGWGVLQPSTCDQPVYRRVYRNGSCKVAHRRLTPCFCLHKQRVYLGELVNASKSAARAVQDAS